jgi:hypothetical protein
MQVGSFDPAAWSVRHDASPIFWGAAGSHNLDLHPSYYY